LNSCFCFNYLFLLIFSIISFSCIFDIILLPIKISLIKIRHYKSFLNIRCKIKRRYISLILIIFNLFIKKILAIIYFRWIFKSFLNWWIHMILFCIIYCHIWNILITMWAIPLTILYFFYFTSWIIFTCSKWYILWNYIFYFFNGCYFLVKLRCKWSYFLESFSTAKYFRMRI
jgi:hypothetical protein